MPDAGRLAEGVFGPVDTPSKSFVKAFVDAFQQDIQHTPKETSGYGENGGHRRTLPSGHGSISECCTKEDPQHSDHSKSEISVLVEWFAKET
jgi:hypothetical protein